MVNLMDLLVYLSMATIVKYPRWNNIAALVTPGENAVRIVKNYMQTSETNKKPQECKVVDKMKFELGQLMWPTQAFLYHLSISIGIVFSFSVHLSAWGCIDIHWYQQFVTVWRVYMYAPHYTSWQQGTIHKRSVYLRGTHVIFL